MLAVELASRESLSSWRELLIGLRGARYTGSNSFLSDDHAGVRKAIQEVLPEAVCSAAMFIFCGTLWIICRAKPMMIAYRSCAGSTIGVMLRKHGEEALRNLGDEAQTSTS